MTYLDRSFCYDAPKCADRHKCDRYLTEKDALRATKLRLNILYFSNAECFIQDDSVTLENMKG